MPTWPPHDAVHPHHVNIIGTPCNIPICHSSAKITHSSCYISAEQNGISPLGLETKVEAILDVRIVEGRWAGKGDHANFTKTILWVRWSCLSLLVRGNAR